MKVIALLSGGKDSVLALLMAYRYGHEPVVAANIIPSEAIQAAKDHEVDSYMYQTVGYEAVKDMVECLRLPLRRSTVERDRAVDQSLHYGEGFSEQDEVEDLFRLLKSIKDEFPQVKGVTSGAILSNYQRHRVEYVCHRLGLVSIAYLWRRQPREILDMASVLHVNAILVKTASAGLVPQQLVGRTLEEARRTLETMEKQFGGHMAGEGGEFETLVLDAPLFPSHRLQVTSLQHVIVDDNEYSPSGHGIVAVEKVEKTPEEQLRAHEVLTALREGTFHFHSDTMPALPTTSYTPTLSAAGTSRFAFRPCDNPHTLSLFLSAAEETVKQKAGVSCHMEERSVLDPKRVTSPSTAAADTAVAVALAVADCLSKAQDAAVQRGGLRPIYYLFDVPDPAHHAAVDRVYSRCVPAIRPPGRTIVSSSANAALCKVRVVCLLARDDEVEVVHNQSISCWAAGCPGPFAQARQVHPPTTPGSSRYTLVGGMKGIVPATNDLATATDLEPHLDETLPPSTANTPLAAQFAFAFANAVQYATLFRLKPEFVSRVTCIVPDAETAAHLPALLAWCCPTLMTANTADTEISTCSSSPTVMEYTVARMAPGQRIELFLEWDHLDDED